MVRDEQVRPELRAVLGRARLELRERPRLRGARDGGHRVQVRAGVLDVLRARRRGRRRVEQRVRAARRALERLLQDLAEQHVLEAARRVRLAVGQRVVGLVGLQEVAVGRVVVLLLAVEAPRHLVELGLEPGPDVDGVAVRPRRRQGRLRLGHVAQRAVDLRLDEVRLDEHLLVVELLQLPQQPRDEAQRVVVARALEVDLHEPRLDALPQEGPLLGAAPRDDLQAQLRLEVERVGVRRDDVQQLAHDLRDLGLGDLAEERRRALEEHGDVAEVLVLRISLGELVDALLLGPRAGLGQRVLRVREHGEVRGAGVRRVRRGLERDLEGVRRRLGGVVEVHGRRLEGVHGAPAARRRAAASRVRDPLWKALWKACGASVFAPAVRAGEKFPAQPSGRAGGQRPMLGLGRGARRHAACLLGIPSLTLYRALYARISSRGSPRPRNLGTGSPQTGSLPNCGLLASVLQDASNGSVRLEPIFRPTDFSSLMDSGNVTFHQGAWFSY